MHASNARKQCTGAMPIRTYVLTKNLLTSHRHLTFRNARARIRISRLALVRARADAEAAS